MEFTLRQLEYFETVASVGSLSRAAELSHVTPSALTLAIDELERHLRVQLLIRKKGRGVSLTPSGARMLRHARTVLGHAKAMSEEASQVGSALSGRFSIGCFTTLTPFFVPTIVDFFRSSHPAVDLQVSSSDAAALEESLLGGRLDVSLLYSVDVPPALTFEPVLEYRPHVIVSTTHPLARRRAVSLKELVEDELIDLDVTPTRHNTRQIFAELGLTPRVGQVSTNYEAVRCMVGAGLGYAILFQRPAAARTYDGHEVRVLELLDDTPAAVVGLCRPAGAPVTARYAALRSRIAQLRLGGTALAPEATAEGGERR